MGLFSLDSTLAWARERGRGGIFFRVAFLGDDTGKGIEKGRNTIEKKMRQQDVVSDGVRDVGVLERVKLGVDACIRAVFNWNRGVEAAASRLALVGI